MLVFSCYCTFIYVYFHSLRMFRFMYVNMVDVVTELVKEGVLNELLYADDLVLMNSTIEEFNNKIRKWKETFES